MKVDAKGVGKRLRFLREYGGLSRSEFGDLFSSKESTVYEWEIGYCIPRVVKLVNISNYFDVSIDCILSGKTIGETPLELMMSKVTEAESFDSAHSYYANQLLTQFNALSNRHKERLIGYLDALCRENGV